MEREGKNWCKGCDCVEVEGDEYCPDCQAIVDAGEAEYINADGTYKRAAVEAGLVEHKPAIKMIAYNPLTGKPEEVFPEDEVTIVEMRPRFFCHSLNEYVSVPGTTAAAVYDKWLQELRKA